MTSQLVSVRIERLPSLPIEYQEPESGVATTGDCNLTTTFPFVTRRSGGNDEHCCPRESSEMESGEPNCSLSETEKASNVPAGALDKVLLVTSKVIVAKTPGTPWVRHVTGPETRPVFFPEESANQKTAWPLGDAVPTSWWAEKAKC